MDERTLDREGNVPQHRDDTTPQAENHTTPQAENYTTSQDIDPDPRPGLAEVVYGILFAPVKTFRKISDEPPLFLGFALFIIVTALTSVVSALIPANLSPGPAELPGILARATPFFGVIDAMLGLLGWFIQAGVFQVVAELLGGKGRAIGVLTVLACAGIPRVIGIPFQVLAYFLAGSFVGKLISAGTSIIVFIWWAVLLVIGLREIQQYSTGRALATLLIPGAVLILAIIIVSVALIGLVVPFLGNL